MSPFDPDAIHYTHRTMWLSTEYKDMGKLYSYFRCVAAAETGLLPPIDKSYSFKENYVDAIR